jgi:hypothetical protein
MARKQTVFISYSHKDEEWKDQLRVHLDALQAEDKDFVDPWDDRRIGVGDKWKEEIEGAMDRSSVAVLLISAHFLTSNFILREEVPRLLARREKGLNIVPIVVRPCNWQRVSWLSSLQLRPKDGRPLMLGDEAQIETDCAEITREIGMILDVLRAEPAPAVHGPLVEATVVTSESTAVTVIAKEAKTADAAVRAVASLASTADMPELLESFGRDLKVASSAIIAITTYKELHDELHTFEAVPFSDILNEHERIATDSRARENLANRAMTLLGTIEQARALAGRLPVPNREISWIESLEQAHKFLIDSIKARDVGRSSTAVILITRVLDRQLGRLNEVMVSQAGQLEVSVAPVKTALRFVHDHAVALRIESEREDKIRDGIQAFERLISGFMTLINEHNLWQSIEDDLRTIDASLANSQEQLDLLWPQLQKKIETMLSGKREAWASKLQTSSTALRNALIARDPQRAPEVRDLFDRFRRGCGQHFLFIDTQLREECGKLANVDESLQLLIRIIDTQGTA